MATRRAAVGMAHPTVVPTNFDPDETVAGEATDGHGPEADGTDADEASDERDPLTTEQSA